MNASNVLLIMLLFFFACQNTTRKIVDEEIEIIENSLTNRILIKDAIPEKYSIEERMAIHQVPSVSITIFRNGKIYWSKNYGEKEDIIDVKNNTLFQAGSISKSLTSLALMKLSQENKIDLDADINNYLISWKVPENRHSQTEKVTARRLLSHTGGINDDHIVGYNQTDSLPSLIEILNGKGSGIAVLVDTIPGSTWRYTGGGYTILQQTIEDITGFPFEQYMDEAILKVLGMKNSTFQNKNGNHQYIEFSRGYDNKGEQIKGGWKVYPEKAAAGLWSTSIDLAKFCLEVQKAYTNNPSTILSNHSATSMLTPVSHNYGLGLEVIERNDTLCYSHDGITDGFQSRIITLADKGDGMAIMTNSNRGLRLIREIQTAISNFYNWNISETKIVETRNLTNEELLKLVGKYKYFESIPGTGDYYMDMVLNDGQLTLTNTSEQESFRQTYTLTPLKDNKFIDLSSGLEISFINQSENQPLSFLWANRARFDKVYSNK